MSEKKAVPGWHELLTRAANHGAPMSHEDLERLEQASANISDPIIDGLAAIGELQWRAVQYTEAPLEADTLFALADFQLTLAALLSRLRDIESNANYGRHQLELAEAKEATA